MNEKRPYVKNSRCYYFGGRHSERNFRSESERNVVEESIARVINSECTVVIIDPSTSQKLRSG